ncbi:MAG TPA: glycoside hydrolase family 15 protein [Gaiellaceae bacterium]|jgi:GH15 family glucan-1,4-alpha-glucosidase
MIRERIEGYAQIGDYGAVGDGRTVALIAQDGAIDWLCLPDLDSPSVFGALLDSERGGRFLLEPESVSETARRYLPGTNVLETTFTTEAGVVRVTDAMTLPTCGLSPYRELARRIEGLTGEVRVRWQVEPRFAYASAATRIERRAGVPVATAGRDAIAVCSFEAGEATASERTIAGSFTTGAGSSGLLVLSAAHQEPLVLPARAEVEARLEATGSAWRAWSDRREYDGPWEDAVVRSALALKLLVYAPSGAIAAAATTSLPEEIGGDRNWDYRYSWPRDSAFTLEALLALGCAPEARAFFFWLLHASQLTHPRLQVLYRLDGRAEAEERSLPLAGYRGSRPARVGNGAAGQTQLDVYGEVLAAAATFAAFNGGLDRDHGRRLAEVADYLCGIWEERDAGIWELRGQPRHFTQSKMMCAVALARACELAERGLLPAKNIERWQREQARIREFIETHCYSDSKASYVRSAGEEELDASLLLGVLAGYDHPASRRLIGTVDAVRRELARGPLVYRWADEPGAFLTCSFWLADAYARQGRLNQAATLMDELVGLANDLGLYAEEMQPETGEFLGNFPQGLTHLGLINAAVSFARAQEAGR